MKARAVILGLGVAFVALCAGCYERVVSAKGYGADQTVVHRANVPTEGEKLNGYKKYEHKPLP